MSILNYFFGTIAGANGQGWGGLSDGNINFLPTDARGGTIDIRGPEAQWWGMKSKDMQKKAYDFCYPVAAIADALADYDITGEIEILRSEGKGKEDYATNEWANRMNKLLAQPNPMQSWEQFRGQQVVYKKVFGYCPVLPIVPFGFTPDNATSIINLPPWCLVPRGTGNYLNVSKIEGFIEGYTFSILGKQFNIKPSDLIILEDSFMQDVENGYLLPQSKLVGLDMAISNICAAMEADNVLLKKKGPLGFISPEAQKDAAGYVPYDEEDKKELQKQLSRYGLTLTQYQYVISNSPTKWNAMSFNPKELTTKETVIAGEKAICHRFRYPYTLYEQQDATYANGQHAEKSLYESNIIPNNRKDLNEYNKFFKAAENKCKITACFDDVASLQEDVLNSGKAADALDTALQKEFDSEIITVNEWRQARGYDKLPDGDVYKSEWIVVPPPAPVPVI